MKRLYLCRAEIEMVVCAETEGGADDIADACRVEFISDHDVSWHSCEIRAVPYDWRGCLPYSNDDDQRTCEQIIKDLDAGEEAEREAERLRAEFDAHPKLLEVSP